MRRTRFDAAPCPIARTTDLMGDWWTPVLLRNALFGQRRFADFQRALGVPRAILARRLARLVDEGLLLKEPYQERPRRYEYRLTDKGLDLQPVMLSIVHWGDVHMAGKRGRPMLYEHLDCGHTFDPVLTCSACQEQLSARAVRVRPGPGAGRAPRGSAA